MINFMKKILGCKGNYVLNIYAVFRLIIGEEIRLNNNAGTNA